MTVHQVLLLPVGQLLQTTHFLLLTVELALTIQAFRDERSRRIKGSLLLCFTLGFVIFYLMSLDARLETVSPGLPREGLVLGAFASMPAAIIVLYEFLRGSILVAAFVNLLLYRRDHPTFGSIKETMDLLPVGIAFGKPDGTVVFSNLSMNSLSRVMTGKGITNTAVFLKAASGALGDTKESRRQVYAPDGSGTWQLSAEVLEVEGAPYVQLTAADVTHQAEITEELSKKNKTLMDIRRRLDIYNKQAERIVIAQEFLAARMAVHSEVGNMLLEGRHYLKDPDSFDEEVLLRALKNTNTFLLREYERKNVESDSLAEALEAAETIGVEVALSGAIPEKDPQRMILAAAISECASNTAKHADGERLSVKIQQGEGRIAYTLVSSGSATAGEVRETGGLLTLRVLVEREGGEMKTSAGREFSLTIYLPDRE